MTVWLSHCGSNQLAAADLDVSWVSSNNGDGNNGLSAELLRMMFRKSCLGLGLVRVGRLRLLSQLLLHLLVDLEAVFEELGSNLLLQPVPITITITKERIEMQRN
uniref:Uncharacterized protein n=1 Tax=Cannabis sativa TaxID=3483 RepID=A0A803QJZ0_CANSA